MMGHSGKHLKTIWRQFIQYIFPIHRKPLDRTGQLRTPTVTNEILEIRRIDPYKPPNLDRPETLPRVRVGNVATHLLWAHIQDLGRILDYEQRLWFVCGGALHLHCV